MPLDINIHEVDSISILEVTGAIVCDSVPDLRNEVRQLLAMGKKNFLLNLEHVSSIDEFGLGCLVAVCASAAAAKGSEEFLRPSSALKGCAARLLIPVYLGEMYEDESEALASFKQSRHGRWHTLPRTSI